MSNKVSFWKPKYWEIVKLLGNSVQRKKKKFLCMEKKIIKTQTNKFWRFYEALFYNIKFRFELSVVNLTCFIGSSFLYKMKQIKSNSNLKKKTEMFVDTKDPAPLVCRCLCVCGRGEVVFLHLTIICWIKVCSKNI